MSGRTRAAGFALGLATVVATLLVAGRIATRPDPFTPLVEAIVRTPQNNDGEHLEQLVALGPDAVPAIGKALLAGAPFPMTYILALDRIGDEDGMKPILTFVAKQAPYSNWDRSTSTARSILALRGVGNTAACRPTRAILRDETAHPRVRLAAASTCSHLCSGDVKAEAQRFILDAYDDRARYWTNPNGAFTPPELYFALIDVDNEQSLAILLEGIEGGSPPHIAQPVIAYLARKDEMRVADSLERMLGDSHHYELTVRLGAVRAILDAGRSVTPSLRSKIDELANEASRGTYEQAIVDEAQLLRARAAQR